VKRLPLEPAKCAEQLASAAILRKAAILARMPAEGTWDRAVAAELSLLAEPPCVLLVEERERPAGDDVRGDRFEVAPTLDEGEAQRWWGAVAEEGHHLVPSRELVQLDAWWESARRAANASAVGGGEVPETGRGLFLALALAGRPWDVTRLGDVEGGDDVEGALDVLVTCGAAQVSSGWAAIAPAWEERAAIVVQEASLVDRRRVADALAPGPGYEPWSFARAAELLAHPEADEATLEAADRAHASALAAIDDSLARREVVSRWIDALEGLPVGARRDLLLRAAERALAAGEPDEAVRCVQVAAVGSDDARVLLLKGRAATALGDMVVARVALERALRLLEAGDATPESRELGALATIELAEVSYLTGDVEGARRAAEEGIARTADPCTVLKGRNVLGKLLLAQSRWADADRHFAEDEMLAAQAGDATGELRARLNRGIALLSQGLADDARAMFLSVLTEGERRNEPRACAYALSNLGHLAAQRHEYGASLEHWERAIKLNHAMRDRPATARVLVNLAGIRFLVGSFDHAEHALSFARRVLGAAVSSSRAAQLDLVSAHVALARGRTLDARRDVEAAIAKGRNDKALLGDAYRLGVRTALEDGDLVRAREGLARAREEATTDVGRAENALLHALCARAAGEESLALAGEALALVRAAGEESLLREAHVLLAELRRVSGELESARAHVAQAVALSERVASRIPAELRAAYRAKPEVVRLERLRTELEATRATAPSGLDLEASVAREVSRGARGPIGSAEARTIVGDDPAIRGLLAAIRKVARATSTVLIRGESGTGKELVAEAIHRASERSAGPLVRVNCAALVETLLLSELFGHEKGSFTGAFARRRGRFEMAEGGTLFLDEIGDISPRTQVALLRVLQERTFERVGGTTAIHADVRVVCATHRDLRAMVDRGEFREDLYYRLRGITLEVPALRARLGDLASISAHLLERIAAERGDARRTLGPDAVELLMRHRWPGNVRELENALRVASLFAESSIIRADDLTSNVDDLRYLASPSRPTLASAAGAGAGTEDPPVATPASESDATLCDVDSGDPEGAESDAPLPQIEANATSVAYAQVRQGSVSLSDMKRQIERDCIARALAETKGNITRAAALLGMKRPRLSQLVKQYGLAAVSSEGSG
jgi:transcriptional regulator with GAF, ATPase, and Fis domain